LDIALDSSPGRRRIIQIQIIISLIITITIATTSYYILLTITATRGTNCGAHPLPTATTHQRGATPLHDHHSAVAGIYHALAMAREQSRGHKTFYI